MPSTLLQQAQKVFKAFAVRFDSSPITQVSTLSEFCKTRSSYVAQTAFYGYMRTRMGTSYRKYFEDPEFARLLQAAAAETFATALADCCIYAGARCLVNRQESVSRQIARKMIEHCYAQELDKALQDVDDSAGLIARSEASLRERMGSTGWFAAVSFEQAFTAGAEAMIEHAPVSDEFKQADREIIVNSFHNRWQVFRSQLDKRLDCAAVMNDATRLFG